MPTKTKRNIAVKTPTTDVRRSGGIASLTDATSEAAAWANVSGLAQTALAFWNNFIGLQSGTDPLDPTDLARLTCIIRAVSWVESQHGTGAGSSASVDPMQCGNPQDSWWKELTDCSGGQDRFVRGPNLSPNYNACELPAAAAADASFPAEARLSNLTDKTSGHDDANFIQKMSYCWGVPFLIWKINNTAGDKTYQCQDLNRDRLVEGAVAYNGGGDPGGAAAYRAKIVAALNLSGCLAVAERERDQTTRPSTEAAQSTAESVLREIVKHFEAVGEPGKRPQFFPDGIGLIEITVEVGNTKVQVRVAGPKSVTAS